MKNSIVNVWKILEQQQQMKGRVTTLFCTRVLKGQSFCSQDLKLHPWLPEQQEEHCVLYQQTLLHICILLCHRRLFAGKCTSGCTLLKSHVMGMQVEVIGHQVPLTPLHYRNSHGRSSTLGKLPLWQELKYRGLHVYCNSQAWDKPPALQMPTSKTSS